MHLAAGVYTQGQLLSNRYRIERLIGQGGMGKVYLATDQSLERSVVIKLAHLQADLEEEDRARFRREALKMASLNHPNIVAIYDYGTQNDLQFLVMEWVNGGTLKEEFLQTGSLSLDRFLQIISQLLSGLWAAHKQDVIHRDIKPSNLMWDTSSQRLKVLDFGLARGVEGDTLTGSGHVHGSIQYMAPEQIKGEAQDQRTDIYAVGILVYQLLCGVLPFVGDNTVELMFQKIQAKAPKLLDQPNVEPWVTPELASWVDQCLSIEPSTRPENAEECLSMIKEMIPTLRSQQVPKSGDLSELPLEWQSIEKYNPILTEPVATIAPVSYSLPRRMFHLCLALLLGAVVSWGIFSSISTPAADSLKPPESKVHILVSDPLQSAEVRIDGQKRGQTPLHLSLRRGAHRVEVSHKGLRWETTFNLQDGETLRYEALLPLTPIHPKELGQPILDRPTSIKIKPEHGPLKAAAGAHKKSIRSTPKKALREKRRRSPKRQHNKRKRDNNRSSVTQKRRSKVSKPPLKTPPPKEASKESELVPLLEID